MHILHGAQLLQAIDSTAKAKEFSNTVIFDALEAGFVEAYKKKYGIDKDISVQIDKKTGDIKAFWVRQVLDAPTLDVNQISLDEARKIDPSSNAGDSLKQVLPALESSLIVTNLIRKILTKKIVCAEKVKEYEIFKSREGDLVFGVIKSIDYKGNYIISLAGGGEGFIATDHLLANDHYKISDRIRAYIYKTEQKEFGYQIYLSRTHTQILNKLFELEIPQIYDDIVVIKSVARDPGSRAKVAVFSKDISVNPVSACIGAKGIKIKNITNELQGEKIDLVLWDQDMHQFILNAFDSTKIYKIIIYNDVNIAQVIVDNEHLSLLIGRKGQNIRLVSKLVGMQIKIFSRQEHYDYMSFENAQLVKFWMNIVGVDESLSNAFATHNVSSFEEFFAMSLNNLAEVAGTDVEKAKGIQSDIKLKLENVKSKSEEYCKKHGVEDRLLSMLYTIADWNQIDALVSWGIKSLEDLACSSADEISAFCDVMVQKNDIKIRKLIKKSQDILNSHDLDYKFSNVKMLEPIEDAASDVSKEAVQQKQHDTATELHDISNTHTTEASHQESKSEEKYTQSVVDDEMQTN